MAGQVIVSRDGDSAAIAVNGRFDFYVHKEFREAYEELLSQGVLPHLTVNMQNVEYIDSSALGMLLVLRERVGEKVRINLTYCRPAVESVLEIANFHTLFNVA